MHIYKINEIGCNFNLLTMDRSKPRYRPKEDETHRRNDVFVVGDRSDSCGVIRNHFATGDGIDPVASLKSLQEIFREKLDTDVVQLVFSECGCNVDQALETLFTLVSEENSKLPLVAKNTNQGATHSGDHQSDLDPRSRKSSWNEEFSSVSANSGADSDSSEMDSRVSSDDCRQVVDVICHKTGEDEIPYNRRLNTKGFTSQETDLIQELRNLIENDQNKILVILRGLPGSGKSTLAKSLKRNGVVLSTDDFFWLHGSYRFDPSRLSEAHVWNRRRTQRAMEEGRTPVIIDNTNTQKWEFRPYVLMGEKFNYVVRLAEPQTKWKFRPSELAKRNTHGVSKESIVRMLERYEHDVKIETLFKQPANEKSSERIAEPAIIDPSAEISLDNENRKGNSGERIGLEDLMALVQHDSEESSSISRRTSASSSQDTSGWECDEEFLWSVEGNAVGKHLIVEEDERSSSSSASDTRRHDLKPQRESTLKRISKSFKVGAESSVSRGKQSGRKARGEKAVFEPSSSEPGLKDLMLSSDWSIPEYPQFDVQEPRQDSDSVVPRAVNLSTSHTQTEVSDFVRFYRVQNGLGPLENLRVLKCMPTIRTSVSVRVDLVDNYKTLSSPVFDKSTMTDGWEGESLEAKVEYLRSTFPNVTCDDLKDVLEKCHWDLGWAVNILLDFGCAYNDPTKVVRMKPVIVEEQTNGPPAEPVQEQPLSSPCKTDVTNEIREKEAKDLTLTMSLDPIFAMQLEELFGPVGFQVNPESVQAKDLQVKIDISMARQIHQRWKRTVTEALQSELRTMMQLQTEGNDESQVEKAPSLAAFRDAFPWAELPKQHGPWIGAGPGQEPLPLNVIMEMERANAHRRKELTKKLLPAGDDLSTKLKRQRLYQIFPGVDPVALDEVFEANNCSFPETVFAIQQATGSYPSPALAQDCEEQLLEKAKRESKQLNGVLPNEEDDLQIKTKRKQLHFLFPGVDGATVDRIFRDNNYSLQESLLGLQRLSGAGDEFKPTANWEDCVMEMAEAASMQFDENWQSWAAVEDYEQREVDRSSPDCNQMRAEAYVHYRRKLECFQKAQEAHRRGMKTVASFYAQQGELHRQKLQEANKRASERIVAMRNTDPNTLDLHGLYIGEALEEVRKFLQTKETELRTSPLNRNTLNVVTGWGRHSSTGQPKLRPAVVQYLQRNGYRFEDDHPGLIKVILT